MDTRIHIYKMDLPICSILITSGTALNLFISYGFIMFGGKFLVKSYNVSED